jgi:glycosyltransferase involved in cell wall biosynthesis
VNTQGARATKHRIAFHDFLGHPFTVQLARALAERRHEVLYLNAGGLRAPRGDTARRQSDPASLSIESLGVTERVHEAAGPRRYLQERRYARALRRRIREYRPDVVVGATGALEVQRGAQEGARDVGAAFVYWLQDVQSVAIARLLARRSRVVGGLAGAWSASVERRLLRSSDAIIAITRDFLPILDRWEIDAERITVLPNWAPLDELPYFPEPADWAERSGIHERPIFLYAGTLGRKHDPSLLVALAESSPAASVVVVSEGSGTRWLERQPSLPANLTMLPPQPNADLSQMLATADVLVALLSADAGVFSVPSKVLAYLAAGRPILGAIPPANQAATVIRDAGAGLVVDPGDRAGFLSAAARLASDPGARVAFGRAGRRHAERAFDIRLIADAFEMVVEHGMNG